MRAMPAALSSTSRRHVAQLMHRLLGMAVFPLRIIAANPLPRGFLPGASAPKAMAYLYPDEDARLLGAGAVPLCYRILYGFLDREGTRSSEAASLTWADVDLRRGAITLDQNKTDDPRSWAMAPGTVAALEAWRALCDGAEPTDRVFLDASGHPVNVDRLAERFRAHLRAAGVDRAELYERSPARRPIRIHDLRATFITIALANGRSESWVQDRTGHRSSIMVNRYRRAARKVAELHLGDLRPLLEAIPELEKAAERARIGGAFGGAQGGSGEKPSVHKQVHEGGLEPPSLAAPEPKPGAFANSATRALTRPPPSLRRRGQRRGVSGRRIPPVAGAAASACPGRLRRRITRSKRSPPPRRPANGVPDDAAVVISEDR